MLRRLLLLILLVVLLVPAGMLTAARLVHPAAGAWVRLVSFTPYAVVLYAAAVVVLLVAVLVVRGAARGLAVLLLVGSVAGLALHAWWLLPSFVNGTARAQAAPGERLRVMSANLEKGQASAVRVVELALANRVDVLVLQEVDAAELARLQAAGIDERFPASAGQPESGVAGTMVFARKPLEDVSRLDTRLGCWTMTYDGDVRLVAVHSWPPIGDARMWRADQRVIRAAAVDAARLGDAVVVGDFNTTPDHEPLLELAGRGFDDAATEAGSGWQPTWPAADGPALLGLRPPSLLAIDHVLVDDAFAVARTETASVSGTDHRALLAILAR
ncbi:endonuclease/exonuclease/phosphatase family protein [Nocardioides mesophilus]|uniref:Endonuclease/exonuclease/phosphatase family protein n=1 Tax=Nocardioides mesophilus TaxID=433659 RepID=A0A7G9R8U8_9ACTN|nr:endonuclease/exonuclease/phosphatase family protein [Nocardioides mesophilus]QNN52023.1 endonuclease/exonuclease/phosphatase family protein [Nocardioides mesophilus]